MREIRMTAGVPILALRSVSVLLGGGRGWFVPNVPRVRAVHVVGLDIHSGEILVLVSESGFGKTTLGPTILAIPREASGEVGLDGLLVSGPPPV
jgi:peptide/nickel transport system ATP-binding protein